MKAQHVDGDMTITMQLKDGIYTIVLCDQEIEVRREVTTSYVRAVYEYSQMICFELSHYATDEADRVAIESIPTIEGGTW